MAVTEFQADILKLLAARRQAAGESYVAGGVALNKLLGTPRRSSDIDLFHDTEEALASAWAEDRKLLHKNGYDAQVLREVSSFVEARVIREGNQTLLQWARDSAFRFYPLISDAMMGLTLHPFDLATNKILAMAGRLEPRDWIDVINCDRFLQPLGYIIWAACGKDPGFNPKSLLAMISRSHYSQAELNILDFEGQSPDARILGARWHEILENGKTIIECLPGEEVGKCVGTCDGQLFQGDSDQLKAALQAKALVFHEGRIGGAWPMVKSS